MRFDKRSPDRVSSRQEATVWRHAGHHHVLPWSVSRRQPAAGWPAVRRSARCSARVYGVRSAWKGPVRTSTTWYRFPARTQSSPASPMCFTSWGRP